MEVVIGPGDYRDAPCWSRSTFIAFMLIFGMWPNPTIASLPLTTWLVFGWFALACINTHNKDLWRAETAGVLPPGDEAPPNWLSFLIYPQYAILASLFLFDGDFSRIIGVFLITFFLAVFIRPVLFTIGALLLVPLRILLVKRRAKAARG
jgi:hypothetical protein